MKTNQTTALPEMPEQLLKEVERLNSFAFRFSCLHEELNAYLDMLGLEYRSNDIEANDKNIGYAINRIHDYIFAISSEIHHEIVEDIYSQRSQSDNS